MNAKSCPICQKPSVEKYMPFCSNRCASVDLGKWFSGSYVIETDETIDGTKPDTETDGE